MNDLQVQPKAIVVETPTPGLRVLIRADAPTYVYLEILSGDKPVASLGVPTDVAREIANRLCIAADKADEIKSKFS